MTTNAEKVVVLPIPGAAVRAITRGALTDPTAPRGGITFGAWAAAR